MDHRSSFVLIDKNEQKWKEGRRARKGEGKWVRVFDLSRRHDYLLSIIGFLCGQTLSILEETNFIPLEKKKRRRRKRKRNSMNRKCFVLVIRWRTNNAANGGGKNISTSIWKRILQDVRYGWKVWKVLEKWIEFEKTLYFFSCNRRDDAIIFNFGHK